MTDPAAAPLVVIAGPTGAGKSELALAVAGRFKGEVVNCDSLQVYRYLDIGTAKLLPAQQRGIPHHLLDQVDPDELFTAGEFARRARVVLGEIVARGRLPLVAGGTGFYLRALLEGLFPGPPRDAELRARLAERETHRPGSLHRLLRRFDPRSAGQIHARDVQKLVRALEVILVTRRPLSQWYAEGREPLRGFRTLKLVLDPPRDALYDQLDRRCERMFASGLLDEVRHILALGFPPTCKPLGSHGYRQAVQVLGGELSLAEAVYHAQRNTRRYAKRQWTWFRREHAVFWLKGFGGQPAIEQTACQLIAAFLSEQMGPR